MLKGRIMEANPYMKNRHLLLRMVKELHKAGYEKLRIVPSVAPTGLAWRCEFVANPTDTRMTGSIWMDCMDRSDRVISLTPGELADLFIKENGAFLERCRGNDKEYADWYAGMLEQLDVGELPYAFAEYFSPTDYQKTNYEKKIKMLPCGVIR